MGGGHLAPTCIAFGSLYGFYAFVEVVTTAGPVSAGRRVAVLRIATDAGFDEGNVTFASAFDDRDWSPFRQSAGKLA